MTLIFQLRLLEEVKQTQTTSFLFPPPKSTSGCLLKHGLTNVAPNGHWTRLSRAVAGSLFCGNRQKRIVLLWRGKTNPKMAQNSKTEASLGFGSMISLTQNSIVDLLGP